jgi:hypothetical protein
MKRLILLALLTLTTATFAQKRDKIKGSKNVTTVQKELDAFNSIEIEDNIEAYLVTGAAKPLEVEADDNLQEVIMAEVKGTTLRLYTSKEITGAKKIIVRLAYTPDLKSIITKHEAMLYAATDLAVDSISIKSIDFSKLFLNVKAKSFSLNMNDKAAAELNLKTENATVALSKNAKIKALISCKDIKLDMYQKTVAAIEGDADKATVRVDNIVDFTAKRFTVKNMELTTESYAKSSISAAETLIMSASGKTVTEVFGNPDKLIITLKKFADNAILSKKEDKDK